MYIDIGTAVIVKFVTEPDGNMFKIDKADGYLGVSYGQTKNGPLVVNYYNIGEENLNQFPQHKNKIFAKRVGFMFQHFMSRAGQSDDLDTITQSNIYNQNTLEVLPPFIYSQTR
jgi:hypothetical protein